MIWKTYEIFCDGGFQKGIGAISASVYLKNKHILLVSHLLNNLPSFFNSSHVEGMAVYLASLLAHDILNEFPHTKVCIYSDSYPTVDFANRVGTGKYVANFPELQKSIRDNFFYNFRLKICWVSRKHEKIRFADNQCRKLLRDFLENQ
jgi:hypothetical protein